MAAFTCLHPYQNTRPLASERDAFLFDAAHCCGLSSNTCSSYGCDLVAAGTLTTGSIELITPADFQPDLAAHNISLSALNRRGVSLRQFFGCIQQHDRRFDNLVDIVELRAMIRNSRDQLRAAISQCSIRRLPLPHNLPD